MRRIAALFVETQGVYVHLPGVDVWGIELDARTYSGPYPVVAHPPCERWGRYWGGGPMLHGTPKQKKLGDDGGCFTSALRSVIKWGGVLEHPEASHAFKAHGLCAPPKSGGWTYAYPTARKRAAWVCCVEQGHYGHPARKATWLFVCGVRREDLPELTWGPAKKGQRLEPGFHSREERAAAPTTKKLIVRLTKRQMVDTPPAFRDVLIGIARSVARG